MRTSGDACSLRRVGMHACSLGHISPASQLRLSFTEVLCPFLGVSFLLQKSCAPSLVSRVSAKEEAYLWLLWEGLFMATRAASCMQQLMYGAVDVCRPVALTCLTCLTSVTCVMSHGVACIRRLMRLSDVMISAAHWSAGQRA
jgi:hypothetical protein